MVKPGLPWTAMHDKAVEVLTRGMLDRGILEGTFEKAYLPAPSVRIVSRIVPFVSVRAIFQLAMPDSPTSLTPLPSASCHFMPVIVPARTESSSIRMADVAGDQVAPPSTLRSRKTSKKLPIF